MRDEDSSSSSDGAVVLHKRPLVETLEDSEAPRHAHTSPDEVKGRRCGYAKRKFPKKKYSIAEHAKEMVGLDKDFYKQRLLDKFKIKQPGDHTSTDLLLYDNPIKARKIMVKSFFKFYLTNIITSNKILTESYL